MTKDDFLDSNEAIEVISRVEHERWAHWQRYLHQQCTRHADGTLSIPAHLVERWERQIDTPYDALTEQERNSDREQAAEYLAALRHLRG